MAEDGKDDRCQRWRKIAIDQLGYVVNLVLTLAIAALGFCFSLLKDETFILASCAKGTMIFSLLALAVSAFTAFWCILNRLSDFKGTARRACNHPEAPPEDELRDLGKLTWRLFYIEIWAFALGMAGLTITLLITYGHKLIY